MIDARDYETTDELDKAMIKEQKDQVIQNVKLIVETIDVNNNVCTILSSKLISNYILLDPTSIYNLADSIENASRRITASASILKNLVRLIPKEIYEN